MKNKESLLYAMLMIIFSTILFLLDKSKSKRRKRK